MSNFTTSDQHVNHFKQNNSPIYTLTDKLHKSLVKLGMWLTKLEFKVFKHIFYYATKHRWRCEKSQKTIADECGVSRSVVEATYRKCKQANIFQVKKNGRNPSFVQIINKFMDLFKSVATNQGTNKEQTEHTIYINKKDPLMGNGAFQADEKTKLMKSEHEVKDVELEPSVKQQVDKSFNDCQAQEVEQLLKRLNCSEMDKIRLVEEAYHFRGKGRRMRNLCGFMVNKYKQLKGLISAPMHERQRTKTQAPAKPNDDMMFGYSKRTLERHAKVGEKSYFDVAQRLRKQNVIEA
jgi:hypothetical protein